MVPPRGFAPRSIRLSADALLLSYGGWLENGRAPRCCPGYLLAPNEAGLLTPSRAILKNGCGGRIRTGDTRRMKPLPYHLATPLLMGKLARVGAPERGWSPLRSLSRRVSGKMVRPAGLAPAFPDWKSGILLLDDDRIVKMKTNTAASPVMDSHPQENFSADLSVFQAHLPWHELYNSVMPKPLVCISYQGGKSGQCRSFSQS